MSESTAGNEKTIGIIAYLSLIGLIIAFVMNNDKKSEFASFHIRQMIGLSALYIGIWAVNFVLGMLDIPFLGMILLIGAFVLWLLGFIGAVQGQKKLIPVLGSQFQDWFKGIG